MALAIRYFKPNIFDFLLSKSKAKDADLARDIVRPPIFFSIYRRTYGEKITTNSDSIILGADVPNGEIVTVELRSGAAEASKYSLVYYDAINGANNRDSNTDDDTNDDDPDAA